MASAHSEAAKMEQIVTEFYAKSVQLILESRCAFMSSRNYTLSSSSSVRPRDKWFNLALRECPAALDNSDLCSHNHLDPMVVDVLLLDLNTQTLVERWVVQYHNTINTNTTSPNNTRLTNTNFYKKTILLLRSLYLTVRLLPAYKIYHHLNSSTQIRPFTLAHRISSFVEPFTRIQEAQMQSFVFTPVDTSTGRLCLSVLYQPSISDIVSSESSTPLSPQLITDYVGSPMTEPLKRFPSLPVTTSTSQGSQSSSPSSFSRRHSWSFGIYRAPSPMPLSSLPAHHYLENSSVDKKDPNFDEYFPSPAFAVSPSPSAPICIPGSQLPNSILRSESAPVCIPTQKQNLPPSSPLKSSRSKSTGVTFTGTQNDKLFSLRKEDSRQCTGAKLSSNSSPQVSFSRSSSQSLPDDFDESDFACPFDVDEDDITDPGSRPESYEQKGGLCNPVDPGGLFSGRKSQDAAVGELVLMLRKAQPLHQDLSKSTTHPSCSAVMGSASGIVAQKTTADALEELQEYRDLKILLLTQGNKKNSHIGKE